MFLEQFKPTIQNIVELYAKILQIKLIDNSSGAMDITKRFNPSKKIAIVSLVMLMVIQGFLVIFHMYILKKLPIIGSISMDYMIVDISELEENEIKVGDFVELIGNNILLSLLQKDQKP